MKLLLRNNFVLFFFITLSSFQPLFAQGTGVSAIGPDGGIADVIRGNANDAVVLVGTRSDGVYASSDGGSSWSHTLTGSVQVNGMVFDPKNQSLVYAATNQGLFVSINGGSNWSLTSLSNPTAAIAIHPSLDSVVYASDVRSQAQGGNGVTKSIDAGRTWISVSGGLPTTAVVTAIVIDPASQAGAVIAYAGTDNAGVYRTSDGGNNWTSFVNNNGLSGNSLRVHSLLFITGVGLFAGTAAGEYFCPGGIPWTPIAGAFLDDPVVQSSLAFGSASTDTIYLGTNGNEWTSSPQPIRGGLYRSTDSGVSWESLFKAAVDVNSIFVPASNPKKIYLATSDGIYISYDGGASWSRQNIGFNNAFVRTIAVMNSNPGNLFAGVYGGGIFKSTNGGTTWIPANSGLENPYIRAIVADPKNSNALYAGSVYGLYKSADTAKTWQKLSIQNIPHDSLSPFNNNSEDGTIRVSPVDSRNLLVCALTGDFMSSTDAGVTWNALTAPQKILQSNLIENIEFDPISPTTVYFSANGVWKSTDLGKTWTAKGGNLPSNVTVGGTLYPLFGIHPRVDPKNANVMYLPTIAGSNPFSVFRTTDGGANWNSLGIPAFDIVIDTSNSSMLICDGPSGIQRSSDAGVTWNKLGGDSSTSYFSIGTGGYAQGVLFIGSNRGVTKVDFGTSVTLLQSSLDFGTMNVGASSTQTVTFRNAGLQAVTISYTGFTGSPDFSVIGGAAPLSVDPGSTGSFTIQFMPKTSGALQAALTFTSTDPTAPTLVVKVQGTSVAKAAVARTILLETTHGLSSNIPAGSISQYFSQFIKALQGSGMVVLQGVTPFDPLAAPYDAIVIAAPATGYTPFEENRLQQYVLNGGFVVMLGDSGKSPGNDIINKLLANYQWVADPPYDSTGLALNGDVVYDYSHNDLGSPASPAFSAFVDPTHPFLKGIDTLVFFGGSSINVSANAVPFLKGSPVSFGLTSDSTQHKILQPVVAAMSQIGKGRILLIGDLDLWSDINSSDPALNPLMGILAGKNLQFALNVFGYTSNYTVKVPKPTPSNQYQIISIPYDLADASILDVLKDLGSVDITKWRLYGRWDGAEYLEFPSPGFLSFKRGEGYWLITKGSQTLTLGSAAASTAQDFFPIQLDSGYNLIGNPFPYEVSWANSRRPTPDSVESWLWRFDGNGFQQESNVMEPFTGYFLKSLRNGVTVYINPADISSPGALPKLSSTERTFAQGEWQVDIRATDGTASDNSNVAGVLRSASDAWDVNDFSEPPPAPTGYLMLSFNHGDWKTNPGRYAGDFRSVHEDGNYWDFDIASAKSEAAVAVQFERAGNIPSGFEMMLVDMSTERVADIGSALSYNFKFNKNETDRVFRLVVGTSDYVSKNTNGIPVIPVAYSLEQNFPNPFNPSTTIQYTLGHSAHVEISIFSLLGQKVKTLVEGDRKIGSYSAVWDGSNDKGEKNASGIYFCRMRTEEFSAVRKLVFLK